MKTAMEEIFMVQEYDNFFIDDCKESGSVEPFWVFSSLSVFNEHFGWKSILHSFLKQMFDGLDTVCGA
jgi:hypothetical protein